MKKRIALLYGGRGHEHGISLLGAENILSKINKEIYETLPILIGKDGVWRLMPDGKPVDLSTEQGDLTVGGERLFIDVAFPILHGDYGEDGRIRSVLDTLGIRCVGCSHTAGAVTSDKVLTKAIASSLGIPTVKSVTVSEGENLGKRVREIEREVGYPVFVKPSTLGSSIGAGRADTRRELFLLLRRALSLDTRALAEKYVSERREIEVGYLKASGRTVIAFGEVICKEWYDYDSKYAKTSEALTTAEPLLDEKAKKTLTDYTKKLAKLIGIRGLSRIDYFLDGTRIYLNEINSMPGFTDASLYAKMMASSGIPEELLIECLIEGAEP